MSADFRANGFALLAALLAPVAAPEWAIRPATAQGIRSQAVVDLTFDEASGDALDSAAAGAAKDNGLLVNGPFRVKSPFWGQSGKRALLLDTTTRQYVQIADSADLDRPEAVSISLLFVNLHPANDGAFHGIFGKRDDAATKITNYGLNYAPQNDAFQVYLNDGSGFKAAVFSVQGAVGYRRPVFLTAVFQVGDAPAPDADEDKDDVLIRLYANGKALTPKSASGGIVVGSDGWLTDVKTTNLVNDVPLTIGASSPGLETTGAVIDEFSLFPRALAAEEAAALFDEVAGPGALAQIAEEARPLPAAPEIGALSIRGLQSGATSVLAVSGTNLGASPRLVVPFAIGKAEVRPGASAERVEFEIAVPAETPAGCYPVRVQTAHGISGALTLAVDPLPQVVYAETGPDKPQALPVAVTGSISGQQQHRIYFTGRTGDKIVVDLECKRLGSPMDPVLELRNPRGAPLSIAWGKPQFRGDTRIQATLFADGVYSVDLHDLAYNAPGQNSYRVKIGPLKLIDSTFPPAVAAGGLQFVSAVGPNVDPAAMLTVDTRHSIAGLPQSVDLSQAAGVVGPAPTILVSDAVEVVEMPAAAGQVQPIDARFAQRAHVPIVINGRISQQAESDRYALVVTPGMTLSLSAETFSLRSPLEAQLLVHSASDGSVVAASEERSSVEYAVPAGVSTVHVSVRDLNRRGGPEYLYRIRMIPSGQPDFSLAVGAERVALARDGTTLVRYDVNRAGYGGPIALSLAGAPEISLTPAVIPEGVSKGFVVLTANNSQADPAAIVARGRLSARSVGLEPPLSRLALAPADARLSMIAGARAELTMAEGPAAGVALERGAIPPALLKGTEFSIPLSLRFTHDRLKALAVRLTLVSTEAPRTRADPTDPTQQRRLPLPLVRSLPEQSLSGGETAGSLRVAVPLDVAEANLDCVVRAEFVAHLYSEKVEAVAYTEPFRLKVEPALTVALASNSLSLKGKSETKLSGTLKRSPGFAEPVDVLLVNLPAGYAAPKVTLAPEQEQFELVVTAPYVAAAADIPNVQLRVTTAAGAPLQADVAVATKVAP